MTYSGKFTQRGVAGYECDGDTSTAYGGSASVSSDTATISLTETITFDKPYAVSSIYFKAYAGGGGSGGGGGSIYLKLYNSSGTLIDTVYSAEASGSVSVDATYSTGWSNVAYMVAYFLGNGGGQYGGSGGGAFYEIQAWATASECAVTGTATSCADINIVKGGKTIIYTLSDCTWVASISTIASYLISGMSGNKDWSAVTAALSSSNFVRTSDTVVTCTLPAVSAYAIASTETVTFSVPSGATDAGEALTASGTATITYTGLVYVKGGAVCLGDTSDHGGYVSTTGLGTVTVTTNGESICVNGASHVCPITGHGTTTITAISTKSYIGGKLILTTECVAGCGAKIYPKDRKMYVEG